MKSSTLPDGMPVLSPGRHRTPRRGACFMELASMLAGERWTDHPACTHPLLADLARQVNDWTSDAGRQQLVPLIPSVVGRRGDDATWLTVSVTVAASVIREVPEGTQQVLAAGLLRAERLCAAGGPELDATGRAAREAVELVPGAVSWVERLGLRDRTSPKTFNKRSAPTMIRCAVEGVVASRSGACDRRLRALLEDGIAACPAPEQPSSAPVSAGAPATNTSSAARVPGRGSPADLTARSRHAQETPAYSRH